MAFETRKEVTTPQGQFYIGPSTHIEMQFPFEIPFLDELPLLEDALFNLPIVSEMIVGKYLHYKIEQDSVGFISDWRITVDLKDAPEQTGSFNVGPSGPQISTTSIYPHALPIAAIILVGIAVAIVVGTIIVLNISSKGWAGTILLLGVGVVGGVMLMKWVQKK